MCQLTLCNLHNKELNKSLAYLLAREGGSVHDDGVGFMSTKSIWKTELSAPKITNLGKILNDEIKDDNPLPLHIRSATKGIPVTKENAHPFDGKYFTLMHNGTLVKNKKSESVAESNIDSDSLEFLNVLDELTKASPKEKFETLFEKAMSNFGGKFAFIIKDKRSDTLYVVRGRSATLYISYAKLGNKKLGYIINTDAETIRKSLHVFVNIANSFGQGNIEFTEPTILESESIFVAENFDIKRIGKARENDVIKEQDSKGHYVPANAGRKSPNSPAVSPVSLAGSSRIIEKAGKIYKFLHEHCLTLYDFQVMIGISYGMSLLELDEQTIDTFIDNVIPKISASKDIRKKMFELFGEKGFPVNLYKEHNLSYPWTVVPSNNIKSVLSKLKKGENG